MSEPIAQYTFRRSVLEDARTYSLYDDRIVSSGGLSDLVHPLRDVVTVHLKYDHTKQRAYYQCFIHTKHGRISLRHVHWRGFADFEDRRATYTPFVKAVLAQLAQYPNVRYKGGSMANFIAAVIGVPLMSGLAYLAYSFDRDASATLALFMLGICLLMIRPSRPRKFDPLSPPADLLPQ